VLSDVVTIFVGRLFLLLTEQNYCDRRAHDESRRSRRMQLRSRRSRVTTGWCCEARSTLPV